MSAATSIPAHTEASSQLNLTPKPYVLQAKDRRQSPAAEILQENNSFLSSRINVSGSVQRAGNSSACRGVKRERLSAAISVGKDGENSKREEYSSPVLNVESFKAISIQLGTKPPLLAVQGPAKENQARCQAPLKTRKTNSIAEPKSAMLPSSSTGKLIERSRQKVAEKIASHDNRAVNGLRGGLSRMQTMTEREASMNQPDQLLSMIELTKNSLCKDQKMIRHYMSKHKKTVMESLDQRQYEKSFEGRKI